MGWTKVGKLGSWPGGYLLELEGTFIHLRALEINVYYTSY